MNSLEDLLRDAYRAATGAVQPETIRPLAERATIAALPAPSRPRRVLLPMAAAAAAVALIVVLTVVVIPRAISGPGQRAHSPHPLTGPAGRYVVVVGNRPGGFLAVRNLVTGVRVARVRVPAGMYPAAVATGDGRHYVVVLWRAGICLSWLYQFRLSNAGKPSALVPYAMRSVRQLLSPIAVSRDDGAFAYLGERCAGNGRAASDLAVVNLGTMRTRNWSIPKDADVSSMSLTAHGSVLAYNVDPTKLFRSAAYVLPTDAPAGSAFRRARVVARPGAINSDVITPDGNRLYYTSSGVGNHWQLRVVNLRTGGSHVIGRYFGLPATLSADPAVTKVLVVVQPAGLLPTPSPSPTPGPRTSTPSASPVPVAASTPSATPVQSSGASPAAAQVRLALIDLRTGVLQWLHPAGWNPGTSIYAW